MSRVYGKQANFTRDNFMKKICRMIAGVMLAAAIGFMLFAVHHPESAFSWSNTVTYSIYGIYVLVMIVLFIAPFKGKDR